MSSDLLIFYCPGARGDFLAAVLTDQIQYCYRQYLINIPMVYHKMHGFGDVNPWDKNLNLDSILQYNSIRIKIQPTDYDLVVQLIHNKKLPVLLTKSDVAMWEDNNHMFDHLFKHVINFADLFDVDFLKDFYQHFNRKPMPSKYVPKIKHNIELQFKKTYAAHQGRPKTYL